jgi:hypothetical protein
MDTNDKKYKYKSLCKDGFYIPPPSPPYKKQISLANIGRVAGWILYIESAGLCTVYIYVPCKVTDLTLEYVYSTDYI